MYKSILGAVVIIEGLIITTSAEAVITFERNYGGYSGASVQETQDGGYIIAGSTSSFSDGSQEVYLIRTDAAGDTVWTQTYGGAEWDKGNSVQETQDGGFIIAGTTRSFGEGSSEAYLIKTDAAGDTVWTNTYGGTNVDYWGYSVQETQGGDYIITGFIEFIIRGDNRSPYGDTNYDVFLIKTDNTGDIIWTNTYGSEEWDFGASVQETQDGGYIIAGSTESVYGECSRLYLIRIDAIGDTLWTQTYSYGYGRSVQETMDGGFIIAGSCDSDIISYSGGDAISYFSDVYLIKTDAAGDIVWTKTYGGTDDDSGYFVQETQDGGFVIVGSTNSFGAGESDVYLIRTDAAGDTVWTQTYGGTDIDCGNSVQETQDGGFIIAGSTNFFGAGSYNVYLIKTDAQGNTGVEIE